MKVELKFKPKSPTIIEGFPGFGLVGTIATEFLIKHLKAKPIGKIWSDDLLPLAAVHDAEIVEPLGIFYDKQHNLVILHALSAVRGLEWELTNSLIQLCQDLKCKELISIEGIGSQEESLRTFYYSMNPSTRKSLEKIGLQPLREGMVIGVTGALLIKRRDLASCIFVESHVGIADSKAAAKIIEILDKYLGLKVDYKPLLKAAERFEATLRTLVEKSKEAAGGTKEEKKELSYLG